MLETLPNQFKTVQMKQLYHIGLLVGASVDGKIDNAGGRDPRY